MVRSYVVPKYAVVGVIAAVVVFSIVLGIAWLNEPIGSEWLVVIDAIPILITVLAIAAILVDQIWGWRIDRWLAERNLGKITKVGRRHEQPSRRNNRPELPDRHSMARQQARLFGQKK